MRIMTPSLAGVMPSSDLRMAFSMAASSFCSQGCMVIVRLSGVLMVETCWMGVGVP